MFILFEERKDRETECEWGRCRVRRRHKTEAASRL